MASKYNGSNGQLNSIFTDLTNKIRDEYDNLTLDYGKEEKQTLQQIQTYCEQEGITTNNDVTFKYKGYTQKPLLTLHDPVTNKNINLFKDTMPLALRDKENFKTILDTIRKIPPEFLEHTDNINFTNFNIKGLNFEGMGSGFHDPRVPKTIYIMGSSIRTDNNGKIDKHRIESTIIHEMAHSYDINVYGNGQKTGLNSPFTNYKGKASGEFPCDYAKENSDETISTMAQQVYTRTLRSDATLRSGYRPRDYEEWESDWHDLVVETKQMLHIP